MIEILFGAIYVFIGFVVLGVFVFHLDNEIVGPEVILVPMFWPLLVMFAMGWKIAEKYSTQKTNNATTQKTRRVKNEQTPYDDH